MFEWAEFINILVQMVVAAAIGGVLGLEREFHGRWAGLRTHMLVAMGAAIFSAAGLGLAPHPSAEATRVVQGIAAGIGFLGAGTILKLSTQLEVKGLTTAASIWLAAALGTAVGLKMYSLSVAATIMSLVVLLLLRPVDKWIDHRPGRDSKAD